MSIQTQPLSASLETVMQEDGAIGDATYSSCTKSATHAEDVCNTKPQSKKEKFWNSWASEQLMQQGR